MMKIFPETIKKYMSRIAWTSVFALLILFGAASVFSQPLDGVVPAEKEAAPEEPGRNPCWGCVFLAIMVFTSSAVFGPDLAAQRIRRSGVHSACSL